VKPLVEKIAVVTGASRGIGRGIALGLGEAGATVYVTGRSVDTGKLDEDLPGTIYQTADEVTQLGGQGIAIRCDHQNDADVEAAFKRILDEQGRIDILVNNIWGGYEYIVEPTGEYTWEKPFWEQPRWRWDAGAG
jgi:NAD(P)-dependent dehydrogenase (short-subunit alcohol dehydrogenase family)